MGEEDGSYNLFCYYLSTYGGLYYCSQGMDLTFCSEHCSCAREVIPKKKRHKRKDNNDNGKGK